MSDKLSFRLLCAAVFLTPLAIYTGAKDNFLIKETLTLLLLLGAAAAYLVSKKEKGERLTAGPLKTAVAIFLLVELVSALNAKFKILTLSVFVLHFCFLAAMTVSMELTEKRRNTLLSLAAAAGYLTSAYGILQAFGIDFLSWLSNYGGRVHSSLGNPNFYGGWLAVLAPLAIERSFNTKKPLWIALAVLLVVNMFLTGTRGAWLAFAVSIVYLFFALKLYRIKPLVYAVVAAFFVILIIFGGGMRDYAAKRFSPQEQSVKERVFKWRTAFEMVKKHPVLGVGAGNLKVNFALYQAAVRKTAGFRVGGTSESNVHNEYFQVWAETGTLGLPAFLSIFAVYFIFYAGQPGNAGYAAGVLGFLIFSLSNFPLRISPTALYLFVFMGLSLTAGKADTPAPAARKQTALRFFVFAVYLILCYKFVVMPFAADVYRNKGDVAVATGNYGDAVKFYETSIKMDYGRSEKSAYDLGEIYRKANRIDDALRAYGISVDIRNYGEVYNNIANCHWLKQEPEKALINWKIAESLGLPIEQDEQTVRKNIEYAKKLLKR